MRNETERLRRQVEDLKAEVIRLQHSESTALYRSLFENNHAVMLLIDPENAAIKDANPAACAYYGWSREELKKLRIDEINTLTSENVFAQMQLARLEKRRNFFFKHRRADGDIRDVEVYSGPLTVKDKTLLYSIVHDITDRRRAEEALRQSEEKFRLAFHTSPDSINLNRLSDGMYIDVNEGFTKLAGYTREEAIGKTSIELNIWHDARDRERLVKLLMIDGHAENFEARFRRKNGQVATCLMSARILTMNHDKIILSITRDITERKRAEDELRKQKEILQKIFDHLPAMIIFIGKDGRIELVNQEWERTLGWSLEELQHKKIDIFSECYPDPQYRQEILNFIATSNAEKADFKTKVRDGRVIDTNWTIVHLSDGTAIGIGQDISERKRADQQREKLESQLRQAQKMEAIGTLAGGIAHDFNNILSVIIGNAEILQLTDVSFSGKNELSQILTASQRAKQLVHQILAFSRQAEQQKLLISLKPVVKETLEFLRASLPSTIQLEHYIKPDVGAIMADPTQMQQVLMNLCANAAHAMEKEGGVLTIDLDTLTVAEEDVQLEFEVERGEYVRLTVSDTGHGIEPGLLQRIFDPYFTTKGPDKGTGLGLSVVHGIVKSHGGNIKVYSDVGKGTVFHVLFPRADGAVKKEEKAAQQLPIGVERILLVDDEKHLVEMYQRMLGLLGYQVETRTSPVEAIEAVRSNPRKYDLVITDMTMPQMTGYNLAKGLMEIRPGLPVILCTGFSDQINEEKARSVGISAFLLKPLLFHDLANTLRKTLDETHKKKIS